MAAVNYNPFLVMTKTSLEKARERVGGSRIAEKKRDARLSREMHKREREEIRKAAAEIRAIREESRQYGDRISIDQATQIFMDRTSVKAEIDARMPGILKTIADAQQRDGFLSFNGGIVSWKALADAGIEAFPYDKIAFGYMVGLGTNSGKVYIYPGFVEHHGPTMADTDYFAFAGGYTSAVLTVNKHTVIYAKYQIRTAVTIDVSEESTETLAIEGVLSDADYMRIPLYCFSRSASGTVSLVRTYHFGNISIMPVQSP